MKTNEYHERSNPSAGVHLFSNEATIVFLTVKTKNRPPWLAQDAVHSFLRDSWTKATDWLVGSYLIMPDHLHLFCAPRNVDCTIEAWILYWKRCFRRQHENQDWCFQSRGWHHRLRHDESRETTWRYMAENPIRKGLVKNIQDWPYRGKIFDI